MRYMLKKHAVKHITIFLDISTTKIQPTIVTNIQANYKSEICLPLFLYFSGGETYYQWEDTPTYLTIHLTCPAQKFIHVSPTVEYSIPKSYDYYCLDANGENYQYPGNGQTCTYSKQCECCRKPVADLICMHSTASLSSDEVDQCRRSKGSCRINVPRIEYPTTDIYCQDYICRDDGTGSYSRCYARWVKIIYDCVANLPSGIISLSL